MNSLMNIHHCSVYVCELNNSLVLHLPRLSFLVNFTCGTMSTICEVCDLKYNNQIQNICHCHINMNDKC